MKIIKILVSAKNVFIDNSGIESSYKRSKGILQVVELLKNPNTEIHSVQLSGSSSKVSKLADHSVKESSNIDYSENHPVGCGSPNPILDSKYVNDLKEELNRLVYALSISTENNDLQRTDDIRRDINFIVEILKEAYNPNTKAFKDFPDEYSKSVMSVRKTITRSLRVISITDPGLARFLKKRIRIGYYCCFTPDPLVSIKIYHESTDSEKS